MGTSGRRGDSSSDDDRATDASRRTEPPATRPTAGSVGNKRALSDCGSDRPRVPLWGESGGAAKCRAAAPKARADPSEEAKREFRNSIF